MFHILGFLFIIVIAVIIIGLALVGSVLRPIFGLGETLICLWFRKPEFDTQ